MRLSTTMIYDQQTRGISTAQQSWLAAGDRLSTGLRVVKPSDDPVAASQAVVVSQAQAQQDQFKTARVFATQAQSTEETTLTQVTSVIQSAQTTIVAAATGTLSDDDRASYATQLEGLRDQLLSLANSTDGNGRYIFGGYKTDAPPFTSDASGNITYNGGDVAITQKVDASRTMTTSHTGDKVFMSLTSNAKTEPDGSAGESNLFTTLNTAIASLKVPLEDADSATRTAASDAIAKTNRGLSNSLNNVLSVRSENGIQLKELEDLDDRAADTALNLKTQMSGLVDADITEAASNWTMKQAALQASYTVFSQMSKMSLFAMNA
ncbi:flagellar hook-associated protein FlgL [Erwinia sp. Leaf53]|uniref:flagellar hook-associated protein FlgL n=1 Tax=Erwinia sp. Leaf53 TaxID=1736225 RepID=UPI0006FDDCAF|nr:flagellar hook-associated protein FlgL [Erwinia sp. Leaf53]KQN56667.1 flagellar biosynthesis protein FlgL [Erwinia sp. Leaf53]